MSSRILALVALSLSVVGLAGCQADISQAMLQEALVGEAKDKAFLETICGRPVAQIDANSAGPRLSFSDVVAKRPYFGKDGQGTAKVRYAAASGAPCQGTMSFDFHQETTTKLRTKRSSVYSSNFDLTNVKVTR